MPGTTVSVNTGGSVENLLKIDAGKADLGTSMERWFFRPIPLPVALLLIVGACLLIIPGTITDMIGLGIVFVTGAYCKMSSKAVQARAVA